MNAVKRIALAVALGVPLAFCQQPVMRQYSVSTLPSASGNTGALLTVKDGLNPTDCQTGGGSFVVYCLSNGTSWAAESGGAAASSTLIIANAASTGTTLNKLAKVTGAPSTATVAATSDTGGIMGVVIANAGTSGSATIQTYGIVSCLFDGATTAGDYVQVSPTTGGDCHDVGSSYPTSSQVLGRVMVTNASAGTNQIIEFPTEVRGFAVGGGATKLLGTAAITPSAINDGACQVPGTTITVTGASIGDPVAVGVNTALASNVEAFG